MENKYLTLNTIYDQIQAELRKKDGEAFRMGRYSAEELEEKYPTTFDCGNGVEVPIGEECPTDEVVCEEGDEQCKADNDPNIFNQLW